MSLDPENLLASYQLAHLLRQQQRHEAALRHVLTAWRVSQAQVPTAGFLHLEILNLLFVLLGITGRHDALPDWFVTFERFHNKLKTLPLGDDEQQQLREEEGRFALARALRLSSLPPREQGNENLERQLDFLAQAIAKGPLPTRHFALHREANVLRRLEREDDAIMTYMKVIQQWPDDRRARFRLSLLSAVRQAAADDREADRALTEALSLAFADADATPSPLTPQSALDWLQRAAPYSASFVDVTDSLTAYGHMLLKRRAYAQAIEILTPLYTRVAEPRQAYFLAQAHYACSQQEALKADRQCECQRALAYAKAAVASEPLQQVAQTLLHQIEADARRFAATKRRATTLTAYRQQVGALFTRYGVPYEEQVADQPAEAPWLAIYEHAALEETIGNPMVSVRLVFNRNADGDRPSPSIKDVLLYAQYQHAAQQIVQRHGVTSLTWPQLSYDGETPFESIFPERLALNRDILVVAYSEPKLLVRYARLLQVISQQLETVSTMSSPMAAPALMAAARYLAVAPLVQHRLRVLGQSAPSTEMGMLQVPSASAAFVERHQHLQAFADAYLYFDAIASTMRDALDMSLVHMPTSPAEEQSEQRQNRRVRGRDQRDDRVIHRRSRGGVNRSPYATLTTEFGFDV
jgi:tetratricopeptide (TPR) repeat protein